MSWYYVDGVARSGPCSDEEFAAKVNSGVITAATLVWREGMAEWQPYNLVAANAGAGPMMAAALTRCVQCGRAFDPHDLMHFQGMGVCAECKPLFLQRLREGAIAGVGAGWVARYGGFWIRFAAVFIDGILLNIVGYIVKLLLGLAGPVERGDVFHTIWLPTLVQYAIAISYETYLIGAYGATLGKMACGLKVVVSDGTKVGYGRAFGRYWAKLLSGLILGIGYIMAGFDSEKRALHDHICNTRVVRK